MSETRDDWSFKRFVDRRHSHVRTSYWEQSFPPLMMVSLRIIGGMSGGGRLVASRSVKRALQFG
jgi:hypothetical protein